MNIIFEYDDKKLVLPVNPSSVKVTKPSPAQKVEVIGIGEVSVPTKRKLATVSISSFFWQDLFNQSFLLSGLGSATSFLPSSLASSLNVNNLIGSGLSSIGNSAVRGVISSIIDDSQKFTVLNEYVKWFEDWQASKKAARWTIVVPPNEPPQCFDFYVTCENFDYEIRAGEDSDYYYNLELLEWRDYGAIVLNSQKQSDGTVKYEQQQTTRQSTKSVSAQIVNTTEKSSIWSTAVQYCEGNWKDLYNETVNKTILATSPQDISGKVLKIPKQYVERVTSG